MAYATIIRGNDDIDELGVGFSQIGDFNGDGIDEFAITALYSSAPDQSAGGDVFVVYGTDQGLPTEFDPDSLDGTNGFRLVGAIPKYAGPAYFQVSAAGDINNDGLDDLIIADDFRSYVLFGSSQPQSQTIDLTSLTGDNGFYFTNAQGAVRSIASVAAAGDINGDGIDDIIAGAQIALPGPGQAYVIFGSTAPWPTTVETTSLDGTTGFIVQGAGSLSLIGQNVASAGDLNLDGFDDFLISGGSRSAPRVIFGKSDWTAQVDPFALDGSNGFNLTGGRDLFGVQPLGDVNGDGNDDIVVWDQGAVHVVFGTSAPWISPFDVDTLDGSNGGKVVGIWGSSNYRAFGAGDVNGDGINDILVSGRDGPFVLFGGTDVWSAEIRLSDLDGSNGYRFAEGGSIAAAGDINADGFDDIAINYNLEPDAGTRFGTTYILFGGASNLQALDAADGSVDGILSTAIIPQQPSTFEIAPSAPGVLESIGSVTFTITRSNSNIAETVYVSTVQDQGFLNEDDYSGLLNQREDFAIGDAGPRTINVPIIDDAVAGEGTETFRLIVQENEIDPISVSLASTIFSILDNDETANLAPTVLGPSEIVVTAGEFYFFGPSFSVSDPDGDEYSLEFSDDTMGTDGGLFAEVPPTLDPYIPVPRVLGRDGSGDLNFIEFDVENGKYRAYPFQPYDLAYLAAQPGTNIIEITATDEFGNASNPLLVTITSVGDEPPDNTAPMLDLSGAVSVSEGDTFIVDVNATDDSDSEGSGLTYSLLDSPDMNFFDIDPNTGEIRYIIPTGIALDADSDGDGLYEVAVQVTDSGGLSDTGQIAVTVEAAVLADADSLLLEYFARQSAYGDGPLGMIDAQEATGNLETFLEGWEIEYVFGASGDTFRAVALRKDGSNPVLAFRGTTSPSDWSENFDRSGVAATEFSDGLSVTGTPGPAAAIGPAPKLSQWITANDGLSITGHSQGGAQAQRAGIFAATNGATVNQITTFNSAGIEAPAAGALLPAESGVRHFVNASDVVSVVGSTFLPGTLTYYDHTDDVPLSLASIYTAHTAHWAQGELRSYFSGETFPISRVLDSGPSPLLFAGGQYSPLVSIYGQDNEYLEMLTGLIAVGYVIDDLEDLILGELAGAPESIFDLATDNQDIRVFVDDTLIPAMSTRGDLEAARQQFSAYFETFFEAVQAVVDAARGGGQLIIGAIDVINEVASFGAKLLISIGQVALDSPKATIDGLKLIAGTLRDIGQAVLNQVEDVAISAWQTSKAGISHVLGLGSVDVAAGGAHALSTPAIVFDPADNAGETLSSTASGSLFLLTDPGSQLSIAGGNNLVWGLPSDFDGTTVRTSADATAFGAGFTTTDALFFSGVSFGSENLVVTKGSAILGVDYDQDGTMDATVTMAGDYRLASFTAETGADGTYVRYLGNANPVPDAESLEVTEDGTLVVTVATLLAGDTDPDGDALTVTAASNPQNGTVLLDKKGDADSSNDEVIFTPTPGYSGDASFDYEVSDGFGGTATATVAVNVTDAPNLPPNASPIDAGTVLEDAGVVTIDLLGDAGASDGDGGTLGVANVSVTDQDGAAVVFGLTAAALTIDPTQFAEALASGESAVLKVAYEVTDGQGGVTPNTGQLVVDGLDGPFTWYLDGDADGYGIDDAATNLTAYAAPAGTSDVAGDADDADAAVYPGAPEINDGKDNDQDGGIDEDNTAPVADAESFEVAEDGTLTVAAATLLEGDTDADGDALTVTSVSAPVNGAVSLDDKGDGNASNDEVIFTPTPGYSGAASFDYTVNDGFGGADTVTVAVNVTEQIPSPTNSGSPFAIKQSTNGGANRFWFDGDEFLISGQGVRGRPSFQDVDSFMIVAADVFGGDMRSRGEIDDVALALGARPDIEVSPTNEVEFDGYRVAFGSENHARNFGDFVETFFELVDHNDAVALDPTDFQFDIGGVTVFFDETIGLFGLTDNGGATVQNFDDLETFVEAIVGLLGGDQTRDGRFNEERIANGQIPNQVRVTGSDDLIVSGRSVAGQFRWSFDDRDEALVAETGLERLFESIAEASIVAGEFEIA